MKSITGNRFVDMLRFIDLEIYGIPSAWFHKIVGEEGRPDFLAIVILKNILNSHKAIPWRYEDNPNVDTYKKMFDDDFFKLRPRDYASLYNVSDKDVVNSLKLLCDRGIVKLYEDKDREALYVELVPEPFCDLCGWTIENGAFRYNFDYIIKGVGDEKEDN